MGFNVLWQYSLSFTHGFLRVYIFWSLFFFKKDYLFIYVAREGEKQPCVVASYVSPTGDLAHNPGMCPDWESNWRPLGLQAGAQSTEPHGPGLFFDLLKSVTQNTESSSILSFICHVWYKYWAPIFCQALPWSWKYKTVSRNQLVSELKDLTAQCRGR